MKLSQFGDGFFFCVIKSKMGRAYIFIYDILFIDYSINIVYYIFISWEYISE